MQPFPKCIRILDYPDPESRKDLWATPRAPMGIAEKYHNHVFLLYWKGKPLTIVAQDVPKDAAIEYALGPAFSIAPPLLICCNGDTILETLELRGNSYVSIESPLLWTELERMPPGQISPTQAEAVIEYIAEENRRWFEDERSQRVVNALPRIFPEGTIILYELLQNATDSGATRSAFRIENNTLIFLHNGDPFTENDVAAISFVNWSFKTAETIGFMGLGFKAAYEVSARPEVNSPPYEFFFDGEQDGGSLFPLPLATDLGQGIPKGFTTLFRFPLKPNADSWVKKELERFDGRLLLYIGGQLSEVETPNRRFSLRPIKASNNVQHVALESSISENPRPFVVFRQPFTPSEEATSEFARSRNANPESYQGRTQQVSIATELLDGNVMTRSEGQLQVYLPTSISLPFAFDVQGNFIIDASRQQLRRANGPWNSEHFAQIGELLANVLSYAKDLALTGEQNWITYYDLLPLWEEIPERFSLFNPQDEETTSPTAKGIFNQRLLTSSLIPATDKYGNLVFDSPDKVTYIDPDLEELIESRELAKLANIRPLWPGLSDKAKEGLGQYVNRFGPIELAKCLHESDWETRVPVKRPMQAFNLHFHAKRSILLTFLLHLEYHLATLFTSLYASSRLEERSG